MFAKARAIFLYIREIIIKYYLIISEDPPVLGRQYKSFTGKSDSSNSLQRPMPLLQATVLFFLQLTR